MCQSQADGGKRCATHTRPAYTAAVADIMNVPEPDRPATADRVRNSIITHALTPAGAKELNDLCVGLTHAYTETPAATATQETARQELLATLRLSQTQAEIRAEIEENVRRRDRYMRTGTHAEHRR